MGLRGQKGLQGGVEIALNSDNGRVESAKKEGKEECGVSEWREKADVGEVEGKDGGKRRDVKLRSSGGREDT